MADTAKPTDSAAATPAGADAATGPHGEGEFAGPDIPVADWMTVPMSDSADWMNREPITYEGEGEFGPDATPAPADSKGGAA